MFEALRKTYNKYNKNYRAYVEEGIASLIYDTVSFFVYEVVNSEVKQGEVQKKPEVSRLEKDLPDSRD